MYIYIYICGSQGCGPRIYTFCRDKPYVYVCSQACGPRIYTFFLYLSDVEVSIYVYIYIYIYVYTRRERSI